MSDFDVDSTTPHNQITTGDITAHNVNIAAGDIRQTNNLILPTQAEELRARRQIQERDLAAAAEQFAAWQERLRQELDTPQRPPEPYKKLDYFDPGDQAIFFGRDDIAEALTRSILHANHRLTVLHAPSGTGKTSLIRAGLIPRLLQRGCYSIWTTPLPYPENIYAPLTDLQPPAVDFRDLPLRDFFGLALKNMRLPAGGKLVLFIDQFERVFHQEGAVNLAALERDLAAFARGDDASFPARVVIAIRADCLWMLDKLRTHLPDILTQRELLPPLDSAQALQAITAPLADRPVQWQPEAAQAVLDYLARGEIETPHLQLICAQLYEKAVKNKQSRITREDVDEPGLAELHRQYLRNELALLPDEELGWALLKRLVDSRGNPDPQYIADLPEEMRETIDWLVERRALRRTKKTTGMQIEVVHDTLAEEIHAHATPQEIRRKAARELIRRGLEDWRSHASHPLLDLPRLKILDEYRDVLSVPLLGERTDQDSKQAVEFLLHSAVQNAPYAAAFWLDLADQSDLEVELIFTISQKVDSFLIRKTLVTILANLGEKYIPAICAMLTDEYPQVRMAAIAALEQLQPSGEWRGQLRYECYVPAGEFIMGDDQSNQDDEKPAHPVSLDAFYIGRYPVTNADYARYMRNRNRPFEIPEGKENHPVVRVTWEDAMEYARWAGMRLLSEAEWEKAAGWEVATGKGQKCYFPWGNEYDPKKCNCVEAEIGDTSETGRFSPQGGDSPCGAADMAGNVWEWTSSLFQDYPYKIGDGREDASKAGPRVLRGGSFINRASFARCAFRLRSLQGVRYSTTYGFRVGSGVPPILSSENSEL